MENNFYTIKEFCNKYSWPTEPALRRLILIARKEKNDFIDCFRMIHGRILVNECQFWECINKNKMV